VLLQELDKVLDQWQWISQESMTKLTTVGKGVSICFYLAMATQTLGVLYREKALSKLHNRSIVKNGSSCPGIQCDQLANKQKPATIFGIGELERLAITIFERKEVATLI